MTKKPEDSAKEEESLKVIELKAKLEKELAALLPIINELVQHLKCDSVMFSCH